MRQLGIGGGARCGELPGLRLAEVGLELDHLRVEAGNLLDEGAPLCQISNGFFLGKADACSHGQIVGRSGRVLCLDLGGGGVCVEFDDLAEDLLELGGALHEVRHLLLGGLLLDGNLFVEV